MEKKSNYLSSNIKFLRLRKNITLKQIGDFSNNWYVFGDIRFLPQTRCRMDVKI